MSDNMDMNMFDTLLDIKFHLHDFSMLIMLASYFVGIVPLLYIFVDSASI